jgi:hypothetical protein
MLISIQDWPSLGSDSGCDHHVYRFDHVDRRLGCHPERLGNLLCLVPLLLQCRRWYVLFFPNLPEGSHMASCEVNIT